MWRLALTSTLLLLAALATGCQSDLGGGRIGGSFLGGFLDRGDEVQYYPPDLQPKPLEEAAAMKPTDIQK